jgi:uncharacterized protein YijF (DUF1287 family)
MAASGNAYLLYCRAVSIHSTMKKAILILTIFALTLDLLAQDNFVQNLDKAAIEVTKQTVTYDPSYFRISYPNGDVPSDKGVCTDVIIRTYRKIGIDLQKEVHEDMVSNFSKYPKNWGLKSTDTNIDHRRVPFSRHGQIKKITSAPDDYVPGDIVTWDLGGGVPHIGIVINKKNSDNKRYLIVHNIGRGQEISDCLFSFKITGHYTYKK